MSQPPAPWRHRGFRRVARCYRGPSKYPAFVFVCGRRASAGAAMSRRRFCHVLEKWRRGHAVAG
eukprot:5691785-Lingulodinium_polyedra.AAC.1